METDTKQWEFLDSGGEADIYEAVIKGRRYIVKVFTEKQTALAKPVERVSEMLGRLVRLRARCRGRLPRSLIGRGFPIAVGSVGDKAVLVFRYVDGFETLAEIANSFEKLRQYLSEHDASSRKDMALDVLLGIACLELADIVHVDLTTSNTAHGSIDGLKWVYLFDVETAAVMGLEDYPLSVIPARDAHYMLVDSLEQAGIPLRAPEPADLPLALIPSKMPPEYLSWTMWTPVWYGLQLVSFVYLGTSPFHGLPAITIDYWLEVVEHEKERGFDPVWPPRALHELGMLEASEYRELKEHWDLLGEGFTRAMYTVFVEDIAAKRRTPSISVSAIAGIR
ncbi:hypothetical protein PYJP_01460 [Pyrofollis japonicus]|uniref:hypothetical protein n=1 Tax=Pyrofollis japonicus TaxID=3060460 RepID=UPI00295B731C|nr:hypothetical protein [Pyrofollis japonicus]BEP16794.1 hypothetical protein PYJP_01460 [Pyrofollis japonicus]